VMISEGRIVFDGSPAEMAGVDGLEKSFYRLTGGVAAQEAAQ
jgi:hypothetical protein